ncbi:MAG: HAMP domain-containing histidine kinase [Clostridia bacterium]|nr:HAMP domain-containing histidine kinase [Clostridia bacterium]
MNDLNKKDRFTLYVFVIFLASTLLSMFLMWVLNNLFNKYETLNYLIFLCISFLLSSVVASLIVSFLAKRTRSKEELFLSLKKKVSKGEFDFSFPLTGDNQLDTEIKNFNLILKELNSVTILKEDFISNFSHEFKTPIASIIGFAEILQAKPDLPEAERQEYLQIIIDESQRLLNLSKNILLMGKLNSQTIQSKVEKFSIDEQLRHIILTLDNEFTKRKINTDIDLEKINVVASKQLVEHIWINILTNAIKFTKDEISISAKNSPDYVVVKISDNGIGIKQEDLERILTDTIKVIILQNQKERV